MQNPIPPVLSSVHVPPLPIPIPIPIPFFQTQPQHPMRLICRHDSVLSNATTTSDEINLSPRRAARVAMLKARFAGTIFKAKQEVLYSGSNGLENTEDEIKKFRAAEMMKANEYIKEQWQRDREAARLALEEMERNVVIDDNFKTMRDFEMLISGANC
ncbi:hypothetical protein Pyn_07298 [Prunus yedoensis var. nudiflora]|uniref:Uncharacterized protein n=1 Tax=Prunus yedoensis var. nudiflora TaxID=2094558 RepID=A0A314XJ27_PRUYE|nr:hypothetical protein Pyn_07298 [Prunus yedoensis var. nudiflora]